MGSVRVGQSAVFRVDAYADRRFDSRVTEVRSTPKTSNGVVTYQTVLVVDNRDLLLKPGMTATAEITVASVTDVPLVPNAALRFNPPQAPASSGGLLSSLIPRPPAAEKPAPVNTDKQHQHVWIVNDQQLESVEIAVGMTDGRILLRDFPKWLEDNRQPFFVPETTPQLQDWVRMLMLGTSLKAVIECNRSMASTDFRRELPNIQVPARLIHGDKDVSAPLDLTGRPTAALIPGAELTVYPGAPHGLFLTHMERLTNDIAAFARA